MNNTLIPCKYVLKVNIHKRSMNLTLIPCTYLLKASIHKPTMNFTLIQLIQWPEGKLASSLKIEM